MVENEMLILAERFSDAVNNRDLPALSELLDEKAIVWHNIDQQAHTKSQALDGIRKFNESMYASRYTNVRRSATREGVVQQHDLEVTFAEGVPSRSIAICIVFKMRAGLIVRLDEYLDGGAFSSTT